MGIIVNKQDGRSKLQERIAAELREKHQKYHDPERQVVDGVDDMQYLKGTKQTTTLAWAWMIIVIMAGIIVVLFLMQGR